MNDFPENENREERAEENREERDDYRRYTRSEVSDASYMPRDEAPRAPRTYSYSSMNTEREEKPKKKASLGMGGVIALCLLCVLLGTIGGILSTGVLRSRNAETPAATEAPAATETLPEATAEPIVEEDNTRLSSEKEKNGQLDATEIYELACRQVVGISTEVSYQTFSGIRQGSVTGTGFVVSEDGYIITNHHVIEYAAEGKGSVTVMLYDGESYPATIVGYESDGNDVAVLKINAEGLEPAVLGDSEKLRVGEAIYAVGNPLGELDYTMTGGMVSAMNREISTSNDDNTINMFQISAAVNSGNSGGPVYNSEGKVVGIVTAKYSDTYEEMGIEGLGFAIPINDAIAIANDLIENGYVRGKAYMGISTKSYSAATAQYYNWPMGAYVYAVTEGSCAETAGIQAGDIITAVNDNAIASVSDLQSVLKQYAAGQEAEISIYRSGERMNLPIIFDEKQPEIMETASVTPSSYSGTESSPRGQGGYGGFPW